MLNSSLANLVMFISNICIKMSANLKEIDIFRHLTVVLHRPPSYSTILWHDEQNTPTQWSLPTYEGLSFLPEDVFGCRGRFSAGCSSRLRWYRTTGSRDRLSDGQEELNVIVGQTNVESRKLNLSENHMHN